MWVQLGVSGSRSGEFRMRFCVCAVFEGVGACGWGGNGYRGPLVGYEGEKGVCYYLICGAMSL